MTECNNVLVTGFGPFGEHKINASWEAVSALPDEINGFKVLKEQIPVAYGHVDTDIPVMWELYKPKLVLHVGVSSYTDKIQLETRAHRSGYEREDVENKCPADGKASCAKDDEYDCIRTNLCTETICNKLNEFPTLKATISNDPGRYLCDYIYYTSLSINNNGTLFVHVPPLDQPFTKKQLTYALEEIIKCALGLIVKSEQGHMCSTKMGAKVYKNGRAAAF